MNFVKSLANCCQPTCSTPQVVNVPGPEGPPGAACDPCSDGVDAYTTVSDVTGPLLPAVGADVDVELTNVEWLVGDVSGIGHVLIIQSIGYVRVMAVDTGAHVATLRNLGYAINAPVGTPITNGLKVAPAGETGADAVASGVYASEGCTALANSQVIGAPGGDFGFVPSVIIATIRCPDYGTPYMIFCMVHDISNTQFTVEYSGTIPNSDYSVEYIALP